MCLTPCSFRNSENCLETNCFPLSECNNSGTPNSLNTSYLTNRITPAEVASRMPLRSVSFEECSTTMNTYEFPPRDLGYFPRKSMYIFWNGLSVTTSAPISGLGPQFVGLVSLHTVQSLT